MSVEAESGVSLADVEVFYRSPDPAKVGADAFARGSRIRVAPGQERHLAHEAWHMVQQRQGRVKPNAIVAGRSANIDAGLEAEADRMGERLQRRTDSSASRIQRSSIDAGAAPEPTGRPALRIQRRDIGMESASAPQERPVSKIQRSVAEATPVTSMPTRRSSTAWHHAPGAARGADDDVMQGHWTGVPVDRIEEMAVDPARTLLMWSFQHARSLDQDSLEGASTLQAVMEDPQWRLVLAQVVSFLRQTLRDPEDMYSPQDLLQSILGTALMAGWDPDDPGELPGDHPEDDRPGNKEIEVDLRNLDALDFPALHRKHPGLIAVSTRLVRQYPQLHSHRGREPWQWLYELQRFLKHQKNLQQLQQFMKNGLEQEGGGMEMYHRRLPNKAGNPKSYMGLNNFAYVGVVYTTDGQGGIDFGATTNHTSWVNPESGPYVDLTAGVNQATYPGQAFLPSGNLVTLAGGSRPQHFTLANTIVGNGYGQNSPPSTTWHHSTHRYLMIEVDYVAHAKHGHNGGNILW